VVLEALRNGALRSSGCRAPHGTSTKPLPSCRFPRSLPGGRTARGSSSRP
jgi:hypothetical protein